nr:protein bli-3 [Quercus suber]
MGKHASPKYALQQKITKDTLRSDRSTSGKVPIQLYNSSISLTLEFPLQYTVTMPEQLKASEVNSRTDPTVAKQWDNDVPLSKKLEDFCGIVDKLRGGMLGTLRDGTGPVHRAMAVAKRSGPDFLFLANAHSRKFEDIEKNPEAVTITFQDSGNQDWVSVTGKAATSSNEDPRIKEIWSRAAGLWFGDLEDGVHNGRPEDPRMKLIEIQSTCESSSRLPHLGRVFGDVVSEIGSRHFVLEVVGEPGGIRTGSGQRFGDWGSAAERVAETVGSGRDSECSHARWQDEFVAECLCSRRNPLQVYSSQS